MNHGSMNLRGTRMLCSLVLDKVSFLTHRCVDYMLITITIIACRANWQLGASAIFQVSCKSRNLLLFTARKLPTPESANSTSAARPCGCAASSDFLQKRQVPTQRT